MDYLGNARHPNANTPGLIVDSVSHHEVLRICLPIRSLGHARTHGEKSASPMSFDCHFRREPDQ
jgi:hypothetical protein